MHKRLILILVVLRAGVSGGQTIWVDDDDPCADFNGIQAAIESASNGQTILVYPGTYSGNINLRGKAITLTSLDPLDGSTVLATIINGGGASRCITFDSGEDANTVIEGFLIANGSTLGDGGGIYCEASSPTIRYCTLSGNYSDDSGGGIYNTTNSNPTIVSCTFNGNGATTGAAIFNLVSSPTVSDCTFGQNVGSTCSGIGSLLGNPTIVNCSFMHNSSTQYAGAIYNWSGSATIIGCRFMGNTSGNEGAGIFNAGSTSSVTNCTFTGNSGLRGAGIYNDGNSSASVSDCTFTYNVAGVGAAISTKAGGDVTVSDSWFCANGASQIDGAYVDGGGNMVSDVCPPMGVRGGRYGDLDSDNDIDGADFVILSEHWLEGTQ